jgi:hypothetical protein
MLLNYKNKFNLMRITRLNPVDNLNSVLKRNMLSSVKKGTDAMALAKETFVTFCEHFTKVQYPNLHNDPKVIGFFLKTVTEKNYLCNRAFQLALDVTYAKSNFDQSHVLLHFEKYFSVNNNNSLFENTTLDQSTLFTMLQTKIMKDKYPFFEFTVNQTPPPNINIKEISVKMHNILEENLSLTGNRFPDVNINGIPYDYKFIKDPCNTKNQIYLMPEVPEAFKNFSNYLTILSSYYSRNQEMPKAFKNLILNKLVVTREAFLHAKTVEVKKEIIHAWNSFIINVANPRPPNVGLAIVAITEKPLEPTVELSNKLENVPLAEGRLDQTKASTVLKAIIGTYPDAIQNNILVATKGALGHVLIENPFENKI